MRVTLVRAGKTVSFETMEAAGEWLLEQAGVRDLAIVRRGVGAWALCEALPDGTKKVLVEVFTKSEAQLGSLLFRKFYQDWFAALGFGAVNRAEQHSSPRLAGRPQPQPSYLLEERAYIAAFGY